MSARAQRSYNAKRDLVDDVGPATRLAIKRCLQRDDVTFRQTRSMLAVLSFTSAWTKLHDEIYLDDIVDLAGFERKKVRAALGELVAAGALLYEPGHGRRKSWVGLPGSKIDRPLVAIARDVRQGAPVAPSEGATTTPIPGHGGPLSEKHPEKTIPDREGGGNSLSPDSSKLAGGGDLQRTFEELRRVDVFLGGQEATLIEWAEQAPRSFVDAARGVLDDRGVRSPIATLAARVAKYGIPIAETPTPPIEKARKLLPTYAHECATAEELRVNLVDLFPKLAEHELAELIVEWSLLREAAAA